MSKFHVLVRLKKLRFCLFWFFTSQSTIFQSWWDRSTWVELVLSSGKSVLLKDITQCLQWGLNRQPLDFKSSSLPLSHFVPLNCDNWRKIYTSLLYASCEWPFKGWVLAVKWLNCKIMRKCAHRVWLLHCLNTHLLLKKWCKLHFLCQPTLCEFNAFSRDFFRSFDPR